MQTLSLNIPKEVSFSTVNGVQKLTIENPTPLKVVIKIRTNHKTALSIHPTHDFMEPNSKKDVIIKLVQLQPSVKLQVNYTIATEEMIAKNDSKLGGVDKKDIKKEIVEINVKNVKQTSTSSIQEKSSIVSDELNASFATVVPQKHQQTKTAQRRSSLTGSGNIGSAGSSLKIKQPQSEIVVEQHLQEDEYEYEQKMKSMKGKIAKIQKQIQQKKQSILSKRQLLSVQASASIVPPFVLLLIVIAAFLLGSFIKSILF